MRLLRRLIQKVYSSYLKKRLGRYGKGSGIGFPCYLGTPSHIFTGDYSLIQPNCRFIIGSGKFELGKWSSISCNSIVVTGNHTPTVGLCQRMQVLSRVNDVEKDVIVGDDCWVGAGVTLLSGTRIGRGCVVAAGAVVNSSTPPPIVS